MKRSTATEVREWVLQRRRAGYRARAITVSQLRLQWKRVLDETCTGTFLFVTRRGALNCVIVPPAWYDKVAAVTQPTTRFTTTELAVLREWEAVAGIDAGQLIRESLFGTGVPLGLAGRGIQRLIKRISRISERATEVLDSRADAWGWLTTPLPALGGTSPISLLGDDSGEQAILDLLVRIEHGIPS